MRLIKNGDSAKIFIDEVKVIEEYVFTDEIRV